MSKAQDSKDTLIARWMNDTLTKEELEQFKQSPDFKKYQKIKEASEKFYIEKPSLDTSYNTLQLRKKIATSSQKVIPFKHIIYASVATVLLLISLFIFKSQNTIIQTDIADTKEFILPDGSQVIMNAVSKITYNKASFFDEKTLFLEGEAYFKVKKGKSFTVSTSNGDVTVLGTQFNVSSRKKNFEVYCSEGKVQVTNYNDNVILTAGEFAFAKADTPLSLMTSTARVPAWRTGKTNFQKAPLHEVFESLQRYYDIEIVSKDIDDTRKYHGFFEHNDLHKALSQICDPMKIGYTIEGKKVYLTSL